jgi:hypothetical protein
MTSEVEKSNFYKDLERIIDWKESDKKNKKQNENEVKQKRDCEAAKKLMTLSHSFSFCFVTPKVEKSNFYKDLNTLVDWEFTTQITKEK